MVQIAAGLFPEDGASEGLDGVHGINLTVVNRTGEKFRGSAFKNQSQPEKEDKEVDCPLEQIGPASTEG